MVETRALAENLRYASMEAICDLADAARNFAGVREAVESGQSVAPEVDLRSAVAWFAEALKAAGDPDHSCNGPLFGKLTDGCAACAQLKVGRPV